MNKEVNPEPVPSVRTLPKEVNYSKKKDETNFSKNIEEVDDILSIYTFW